MIVPSYVRSALHCLPLFLSLNVTAFLSQQASPRSRSFIPNHTSPATIPTTCLQEQTSSVREAVDWFQKESLDSLLPKADALKIVEELVSDQTLIDDSEALVVTNWDKIEARIQNENRSAKELIGEETCDRLLKSVASADIYDNEAVRAFLGSDAINTLFAKILCTYTRDDTNSGSSPSPVACSTPSLSVHSFVHSFIHLSIHPFSCA